MGEPLRDALRNASVPLPYYPALRRTECRRRRECRAQLVGAYGLRAWSHIDGPLAPVSVELPGGARVEMDPVSGAPRAWAALLRTWILPRADAVASCLRLQPCVGWGALAYGDQYLPGHVFKCLGRSKLRVVSSGGVTDGVGTAPGVGAAPGGGSDRGCGPGILEVPTCVRPADGAAAARHVAAGPGDDDDVDDAEMASIKAFEASGHCRGEGEPVATSWRAKLAARPWPGVHAAPRARAAAGTPAPADWRHFADEAYQLRGKEEDYQRVKLAAEHEADGSASAVLAAEAVFQTMQHMLPAMRREAAPHTDGGRSAAERGSRARGDAGSRTHDRYGKDKELKPTHTFA